MQKKANIQIQVMAKRDLKHVERIWKLLEKRNPHTGLTSSWDWTSTWISVFGSTVPFFVLVGMKGGTPCGIILIAKESGRSLPIPVNAYHLGTAGEPFKDWINMINNDILAEPEHVQDFYEAIVRFLQSELRWEEIVLDGYTPASAAAFTQACQNAGLSFVAEQKTCLAIDLERARREGIDATRLLSHDMRYAVRRNMKAFGEIETEWATTEEQAKSILADLITYHQQRWQAKGKRGMFASALFTSFHEQIIPLLLKKKAVILFRARSRDFGTLGCLYFFVDKHIAFGYQAGINMFPGVAIPGINKKRLKPGFVLHALCMQECLNRGLREYNLAVDDAEYKTELADTTRVLTWVSVRKSIKPNIRDFIMDTYQKIDAHPTLRKILSPLYKLL